MNSLDRKTHWEKQYSAKAPHEVSWYQENLALSLRMITASGLDKHARFIDVGGGSSTLVDCLDQAGYTRLSVLDISAKSLDFARQRLGERARHIEWLEADITEFEPPHSYALWHDRAVFHFFTEPEDRKKYVATLKKSLPPGGHVVLAAFAIGGPTKCSGLEIVQYDAPKLLRELGEEFVPVDEASEIHTTPGGVKQAFSFFHLVRV